VRYPERSLNFSCFAVFLETVKNIKERVVHTAPKIVPTVWRHMWERLFISHIYIYIYTHTHTHIIVMNTCSKDAKRTEITQDDAELGTIPCADSKSKTHV
jgi:hypothetical protein